MNDVSLSVIPQHAISVRALSVADLMRHKELIADVTKQVMKEGTHFGSSFPGDRKLNLLKPGADALMVSFQLVPTFHVEERMLENLHREYRITCYVKTRDGQLIAEGLGTCSTMESKYRYRTSKRKCPGCKSESIIKTKGGRNPGGYWCVPEKGGCGANFPPGDKDVEGQDNGKIENPDIADCWNTCLKISKKRAQVDATITATGCSDMFSQDAEDLADKIAIEEESTVHVPPSAPIPRQDPIPVKSQETKKEAPVDEITVLGGRLTALVGKRFAHQVWKNYSNDQKIMAEKMKAAINAIDLIIKKLPKDRAEQVIDDCIINGSDPDNVVKIIMDLIQASEGIAPSHRAPNADEQPPY